MLRTWPEKVARLPGPILVLGAGGFVGARLFQSLWEVRKDVYAVISKFPAWRLEGLPESNVLAADLNGDPNVQELLAKTQAMTVFDCVAYGAYSFQEEVELIHETNFLRVAKLTDRLAQKPGTIYIHAGSSSEYGDHASAPPESVALTPNSHYAVSKAAVSHLLAYLGKKKGFACANLRLYSIYGPLEDASRLIPNLVKAGVEGAYPEFVNPDISRDFVYIDDACEAFVDTALGLREEIYGDSFNVGTGVKTTIQDLARTAREVFKISAEPKFGGLAARRWDVTDWYADPRKIESAFGWKAHTSLPEGLRLTADWYKGLPDRERYLKSSKRFELDAKHSVSAIIACYKDAQAIPIMHRRLTDTFRKIGIDYEIIFVNDGSPDDGEAVIQRLSAEDRKVLGITHSRNFGSQAAFRSGMEISTKNACVLLDGDLQDPPELIEEFVRQWRAGHDVVYGRRVKRQATFFMQFAYKAFYYFFEKFSYIKIPRDAGDFSLMDKRVVQCLLQFPERDLFLRGVRAFAGFKQTGVDYVRPERMFGVTTNSLLKNIGWAKKGLLSFSNTPLNILSFVGFNLFILSIFLMAVQVLMKVFLPDSAPAGITTVLLVIAFFGSINLFGLSLLGEYLAKVFEEVKRRPHFIRDRLIRGGQVRTAAPRVRQTD